MRRLTESLLGLVLIGTLVPLRSQSGTILWDGKRSLGKSRSHGESRALNIGTDARRAAITNDEGDLRFPDVQAGSYVLTLEAPGFQRQEFAQFDLLAREIRRHYFQSVSSRARLWKCVLFASAPAPGDFPLRTSSRERQAAGNHCQ